MRRPVAWAATLALFVGVLVITAPAPARAATVQGSDTVHGGLYSNTWYAGNDLNSLASATGKRVTFGGTFGDITENPGPAIPGQWSDTRGRLEEVWRGKATPFYNLSVPSFSFSNATLDLWVDHLELFLDLGGGRSLILAPLQEMNGDWTAWGCNPPAFKTAYRRIVDEIRGRGIDETQVRFAFAPNGRTTPGCGTISSYYPGDTYVDIIGISAYRWYDGGTVQEVMGGVIDQLAASYPTKPLMIAQTAAWPSSSKDQWIRDVFAWAAGHPHVVGLIYFNFDNTGIGESDWRVWIPPDVNQGWKDGMLRSTTKYEWPLTSWFQPGALTLTFPPGVNLCPNGADCDTTGFQDAGGRFKILSYATSNTSWRTFYFG
ncbi:MAG: hypothetical protein L0Z49_03195, partial [Actinobacteria bacterium]|nr:hypothetical protein [Actinomycetota bacterium]